MIILKNTKINDEKVDVLIINDRIAYIGHISEIDLFKIFKNDEIKLIDCSKKLVLPGIIDNHVHVTGGGGERGFSSRVPEIQLTDITTSGVTTVVGVLGTDTITRNVENLLSKTKALNEEGISAFCLTGGYEYPSPTLTGKVQNDIVFIKEIIGAKIAISDHRCYNPNKDDLIKLMSEVRVAGLISGKTTTVNYHVGWGKGNMDILMKILEETNIPVKVVRPTHITNNDKVFSQAIILAKKGGYIDITADDDLSKISHYVNIIKDNGLLQQLTISSDANGSCPIWVDGKCVDIKASNMKCLLNLIRYLIINEHYSIDEATSILTVNPASALELTQKGAILNGNDADITILDEEFNLDTVISKGNLMIDQKKILKKGFYEKN